MRHILLIAFSISLLLLTSADLQGVTGSQKKPSRNTSRSSQKPTSPSSAQTSSQTGLPTVELNDPAGDVEKGGADIIKTSFDSDGKSLAIRIELKDEVAATFADRTASNVLELYVDTDRSDATGGALITTQRKGFEYLARVGVCLIREILDGKGEATSCQGGGKGGKIKGLFSGVDVEKYDKDGGYNSNLIADPMGSFGTLTLAHGTVEGRQIEAAIPYTILGVRSGQTIRIMAAERFERSHESRYSRDIFLMLR